MSNSIIKNISLNFIDQKVKTFTSIDENQSHIHYEHENEADREEQFSRQFQISQIKKWIKKRLQIANPYIKTEDKSKGNSFYLLRVEEICDIVFKKNHNSHKLYLEVSVNLLDKQNDTYCCRTINYNIIELEHQTATHSHYKMSEPLNIYFYTKSSEKMVYVIDVSICESTQIEKQELIQFKTYIGSLEIDPFKGLKSKQKHSFTSKKTDAPIQASAIYSILITDSLKILQTLIPPNCLCSCEDIIGGLSGRNLPNYELSLIPQLQYTQLYSFKSDFSSIEIADSLIQETLKNSEMMYRNFTNAESISASVREMKINVIFHNGWTVVNESSITLKEKMQVQKKMGASSKKKITVKFKNYTCDEICVLPFVFMEEESLIIFQISARIQIKSKKQKQPQQTHYTEMPICYSFYAVDKQLAQNKNIRVFNRGDALNEKESVKCVQIQALNIEPVTQQVLMSKKSIVDEPNFFGKMQFYIQFDNINKLQFSRQNVSVANKSIIEVDKVLMHKQRMIRENKKLRLQNRKKKIELNQEIPILDTTEFKKNIYMDEIEKVREERKEKQELYNFLKEKLKEMNEEDVENIDYNRQQQGHKNGKEKYLQYVENHVFRQTSINSGKDVHESQIVADESQIIHIPYLWMNKNMKLIEQVPLEIIKTQLMEQNYSYAFFINWLSLTPISQHSLLPRKFYFQFQFFNSPLIQTPFFNIQQTTGEIQLSQGEKDKVNKIVFIQFPPLPEIQNNTHKFIQFIGYLYHSDLQIKVIDYYSKIQFGQCYFKLRDLIRMRRNEVVALRDLMIKRGDKMKAKLKLEIKCLRKEYQVKRKRETGVTFQQMPVSRIEQLSIPPQVRQQKRIEKYKKMKNEANKVEEAQSQKIEKILHDNLVLGQIKVNVNRMKGQFIWIELKNRNNHVEEYKLKINDPDRGYTKYEQLAIVNEQVWKNMSTSRWWKYIQAVGVQKNRQPQHKLVSRDNTIEVLPTQTVNILCYYYSQRAFEKEYFEEDKQKLKPEMILKLYNHQRCINVTVTNQTSKSLIGMYKVDIIPQPDFNTLNFRYTRKVQEKIQVSLPFQSENNIIFLDDPTVVARQYEQRNEIVLDCYPGLALKPKCLHASLLSSSPENRLLLNYNFTFYGAQQIYIQAQLWNSIDILFDFHSSMSKKAQTSHLLALSEDERIVQIRQKNPVKINTKQSKTLIRAKFTPREFGINYYEVNLVHPETFNPLYRYLVKSNVPKPVINESMTLKLRMADKILEQPFSFTNDQARKLKITALSTKEHLLWCPNQSFEVQAKTEKRIKIKINAQIVTNREVIILCLRSQRISYFYQFTLQVTDLL